MKKLELHRFIENYTGEGIYFLLNKELIYRACDLTDENLSINKYEDNEEIDIENIMPLKLIDGNEYLLTLEDELGEKKNASLVMEKGKLSKCNIYTFV